MVSGVTLIPPFVDIPHTVSVELHERLRQLLVELNALPSDFVLWETLAASWLALNVGDWRFHYRIEPSSKKLLVLGAAKRRR